MGNSIWKREISTELMNQRGCGSLSEYLNIEFSECGDDFVVARMPVTDKVKQPIGIMHGGISCVLAETVGSTAANYAVDEQHYCVGLDINTNHIKSVREGFIIASARPYHLGRRTQVWDIQIHHESGFMVSINRLTMAVLER